MNKPERARPGQALKALRADGLTLATETLAAACEVIAYCVGHSGTAVEYLALRPAGLGLKARQPRRHLVLPLGLAT
ncbi:hypothetical protein ACWEPL_09575 [Nonomuraea sp. NPDC004186]